MWATLDEARDITGRSEISTAELAAADSTVTIFCNRTPEASGGIPTRDLYWLRQATAWQAAWLCGQVAVDQRQGVKFAQQDGQAYNPTDSTAVVLAPLAARALRNLSWKGSRSISMSGPQGAPAMLDFTNDYGDASSEWAPLPGWD